MRIFDTQIISYDMKGKWPSGCMNGIIASPTALEFLCTQERDRTKARYYVAIPSRLHPPEAFGALVKRDRPFRKISTDQLILDFKNDYPAMMEFGHFAVSEAINRESHHLFIRSTDHLEKNVRKRIRERFAYLLSNEIKAIPLSRASVTLGMNLFAEFTSRFSPKENVRNTINDIMILASAMTSSAELVTVDSLLLDFIQELHKVPVNRKDKIATIDFSKLSDEGKRKNPESKGYINRGWQFRIRN